MPKLSVCIPTYEMNGFGVEYLSFSLNKFIKQTYRDFDIVISDHSVNNDILNLCKSYSSKIDIKYYKFELNRGNSSANINNAIRNATGKIIKILFQDDYLYTDDSLCEIVDTFNRSSVKWLVSACIHSRDGINYFRPFYPKYNSQIFLGINTISSPSVLAIKNENKIYFDENLIWLMDCDYYKRCYDLFGDPTILNSINVVNRVGKHQVSSSIATKLLRKKERQYIVNKFNSSINMYSKFIYTTQDLFNL